MPNDRRIAEGSNDSNGTAQIVNYDLVQDTAMQYRRCRGSSVRRGGPKSYHTTRARVMKLTFCFHFWLLSLLKRVAGEYYDDQYYTRKTHRDTGNVANAVLEPKINLAKGVRSYYQMITTYPCVEGGCIPDRFLDASLRRSIIHSVTSLPVVCVRIRSAYTVFVFFSFFSFVCIDWPCRVIFKSVNYPETSI
ncbi:hypothetical protein VTK26DRAFT_6074 [Humicola hyalothermophila]